MDSRKISRRQAAVIGAASLSSLAAAAKANAQTQPAANPDYYQAALDSHKQNSAILARFPVAMSVEPAFQFRA
jgi:hypothetical protein